MRLLLLTLLVFCAASSAGFASDADMIKGMAKPWQYDYQEAASPVMERLVDLHQYIFYIITAITIFVTALLIYICIRFSKKNNPVPSKTTHNTMLEIAWTTIPILILIAIFVPSLRLHYYMDKTQEPDMTLKVTGYQWYWGYSYPDQKVDEYLSYMKPDDERKNGEPRLLAVDNPLVVPVGKKVRVLLTGADVIHGFAMPALGIKTDTIPGRLNETWFEVTRPGIYYGQCSELCGVKHGFMPIEIRAVEPKVFEEWVERAKKGEYALDGLSIPADSKLADAQSNE
jgi:cytochrome c oxidase subunit II